MKITVYTTSDCKYSKDEKDFLKEHNLPYEEKNLETNREFLTEMLAVSNNFAGTPVTKIEKDDGKIEVLKGFTKDEFDQSLGLATTTSVQQAANTMNVPQPTTPTPVAPPVPKPTPGEPTPPPPAPTPPVESPPTPKTVPPTPQETSPELNSILNDLKAKSGAPADTADTKTSPPVAPTPAETAPLPTDLPSVPDFSVKS